MFGLTGRILFSFWLTLILVVLVMVVIFISQKEHDDEAHSFPTIEISKTLNLKLLSENYQDVAQWFRTQSKQDTRRIFIMRGNKEILQRTLPKILDRINRKLSPSKPFTHKKRRGFIFIGRQILLPDGSHVNILVKSPHHKPPLHKIIAEQWLGVMLSAFLISGLISYLLAVYIMKPIALFRQATQKIASGDLSIRVQDDIKSGGGEISLLVQDFDHMADKLERTMASHKHLIQDISHELRSPIARLQLALELCKKRLNISDDQIDIQRIEKECEQLNSIINTLLNLPAYELDPSLAFSNNVNIENLITSICHDLNFTHKDITKHIHLNIHQPSPKTLKGNEQLLRSALENIFKNAQTYHLGNSPIEVSLITVNDNIIIKCCDCGQGVEPDKLSEIFKPFYRTDQARERSSGGHGLGLAISKRAVELHKGTIEAYSNNPSGLCVNVTLPVNQ